MQRDLPAGGRRLVQRAEGYRRQRSSRGVAIAEHGRSPVRGPASSVRMR